MWSHNIYKDEPNSLQLGLRITRLDLNIQGMYVCCLLTSKTSDLGGVMHIK